MNTGQILGAFGLTEPDHGSDPSSMEAVARKVAGGYEITGAKRWIGLAPYADIFIIWAKNENGEIEGYIVEKDTPGLSVAKIEGKVSSLINMLKYNSTQKALAIARAAREILGANGILDDYRVIRYMVNLESVATYEGTLDIHSLTLGRALTGFSAF